MYKIILYLKIYYIILFKRYAQLIKNGDNKLFAAILYSVTYEPLADYCIGKYELGLNELFWKIKLDKKLKKYLKEFNKHFHEYVLLEVNKNVDFFSYHVIIKKIIQKYHKE